MESQPKEPKTGLFESKIKEAIESVRNVRKAHRIRSYRKLEGFNHPDLGSDFTDEDEDQEL